MCRMLHFSVFRPASMGHTRAKVQHPAHIGHHVLLVMTADVQMGQCLVCGGRGGWPGHLDTVILCRHCAGTGRDPDRGKDWYWDIVIPIQRGDTPTAPTEPG